MLNSLRNNKYRLRTCLMNQTLFLGILCFLLFHFYYPCLFSDLCLLVLLFVDTKGQDLYLYLLLMHTEVRFLLKAFRGFLNLTCTNCFFFYCWVSAALIYWADQIKQSRRMISIKKKNNRATCNCRVKSTNYCSIWIKKKKSWVNAAHMAATIFTDNWLFDCLWLSFCQ